MMKLCEWIFGKQLKKLKAKYRREFEENNEIILDAFRRKKKYIREIEVKVDNQQKTLNQYRLALTNKKITVDTEVAHTSEDNLRLLVAKHKAQLTELMQKNNKRNQELRNMNNRQRLVYDRWMIDKTLMEEIQQTKNQINTLHES